MALAVEHLAGQLVLGALLDEVTRLFGGYELAAHWTQGEFHHDVVLRLPEVASAELPGRVLVVATNCNGGVKEVVCFAEVPDRAALWHARCPGMPEFAGKLAPVLGRAETAHWFDPCELLDANARSELRPEHRQRQEGGGWVPRPDASARTCGRSRTLKRNRCGRREITYLAVDGSPRRDPEVRES